MTKAKIPPIILKGIKQVERVADVIASLPTDKLFEVIIREHKSNIGIRQQGYLFGVVYKIICDHTGYETEELHSIYKKKFLINIFLETPDDHPELVKRMAMVQDISRLGHAGHAKTAYDMLADGCHIMQGKRDEIAEFIDSIIRHAAQEFNISVPPPEPDIMKRGTKTKPKG